MAGAIQPDLDLAASLFEALSRATRRGRGIVRDSYGAGEQAAHDLARSAAQTIGLEVSVDAIGNLSMTLPWRDRRAPRIIIGSHLDSVPQGGNYDGATGVVAGLSALSALRRAGHVPEFDVSVMAIRAEESAWFDVAYLGSAGRVRAARSCLVWRLQDPDNGHTPGSDSGQQGFDPEAIRERRRLLDPSGIRAYLELHIEQGPTPLVARIAGRGGQRHPGLQAVPQCALHGALTRTRGAVDRPYRQDAVAATGSHCCTTWKPSGCSRKRRERIWCSRAVSCIRTLPCTGRARSPARPTSCSTCAACPRRPWPRSRRRPALPPHASVLPHRVAIDLGRPTSDSPAALMDSRSAYQADEPAGDPVRDAQRRGA